MGHPVNVKLHCIACGSIGCIRIPNPTGRFGLLGCTKTVTVVLTLINDSSLFTSPDQNQIQITDALPKLL